MSNIKIKIEKEKLDKLNIEIKKLVEKKQFNQAAALFSNIISNYDKTTKKFIIKILEPSIISLFLITVNKQFSKKIRINVAISLVKIAPSYFKLLSQYLHEKNLEI